MICDEINDKPSLNVSRVTDLLAKITDSDLDEMGELALEVFRHCANLKEQEYVP
jgi:hypothetical protein